MDSNTFIMGTIGFVSLWVAYHFVWCSAVRTLFRQQLFRLRDQLFIEAAQGNANFDDPAYGMLRSMMQRTLAVTADINIVQLTIVAIFVVPLNKMEHTPLTKKFKNTIAEMTDRDRAAVYERYHASMVQLVSIHLLRTMPVPIIGVVLVFVLCRLPGDVFRRLLMRWENSRHSTAARYLESAYHLPDGVTLA